MAWSIFVYVGFCHRTNEDLAFRQRLIVNIGRWDGPTHFHRFQENKKADKLLCRLVSYESSTVFDLTTNEVGKSNRQRTERWVRILKRRIDGRSAVQNILAS